MSGRDFRSELQSFVFILSSDARILADNSANSVLDDFNNALACCKVEKIWKYLIWGLLVGRSLDTFTVFFLTAKKEPPIKRLEPRIDRICKRSNPLTSDPAIQTDLLRVKNNRNDLFHNAGRHFSDVEMEDFVFTSTKCIQQLISDLP